MTKFEPKTAPLPGSIVKAISSVMLGMTAVKKSQRNTHGNYNYSSADDIYAALSLKMAEVGLVALCLEDGEPEIKIVEKDGTDKAGNAVTTRRQWLKVNYKFVLATETDTWTDDGARRSLFIEILGPQTFQAAQSYAEKSWLRSLFKIATGDMDLDGLPQDTEDGPDGGKGRGRKPKAEVVTAPQNGSQRPLPPLTRQGEPH